MYMYDEKQMSKSNRYFNDIEPCQVIEIDKNRGLRYKPVWGNEQNWDWIKPQNFEVEPYKIGDWIDMTFSTISTQGCVYVKSAKFIGKTPAPFIPKD